MAGGVDEDVWANSLWPESRNVANGILPYVAFFFGTVESRLQLLSEVRGGQRAPFGAGCLVHFDGTLRFIAPIAVIIIVVDVSILLFGCLLFRIQSSD